MEEDLGFNLFVRVTRKLDMTDEGKRILIKLTYSLNNLFAEIEDIRFNDLRGELYLRANR